MNMKNLFWWILAIIIVIINYVEEITIEFDKDKESS